MQHFNDAAAQKPARRKKSGGCLFQFFLLLGNTHVGSFFGGWNGEGELKAVVVAAFLPLLPPVRLLCTFLRVPPSFCLTEVPLLGLRRWWEDGGGFLGAHSIPHAVWSPPELASGRRRRTVVNAGA